MSQWLHFISHCSPSYFLLFVLPSVTQIILLQIVLNTFGDSSLVQKLLLIDFSAEMAGEKRGERSEQSGGAHIYPCQSEENEPTLCRKSLTEAFLLNTAGLIDIAYKRHYHATSEDKDEDMDKHDDTYPKKSSTSNKNSNSISTGTGTEDFNSNSR